MSTNYEIRQQVGTVEKTWLVAVHEGSSLRVLEMTYLNLVKNNPHDYFELIEVEHRETCLQFTGPQETCEIAATEPPPQQPVAARVTELVKAADDFSNFVLEFCVPCSHKNHQKMCVLGSKLENASRSVEAMMGVVGNAATIDDPQSSESMWDSPADEDRAMNAFAVMLADPLYGKPGCDYIAFCAGLKCMMGQGKDAEVSPADRQPDGRCYACHWQYAKTREEGCVPGDCSFRPDEHSPHYRAWIKRAHEMSAARKAPQPQSQEKQG